MRPGGLLVVSYGGGVDSVASLLRLRELGETPRAIVMADPGSEKRGTMAYLRDWTNPMLRKWDWPEVEVISRADEGRRIPEQKSRPRRYESLFEQCTRQRDLPSIAYGHKTCSQKFKSEPQQWWAKRQDWAKAEWAAGRKLVKAFGYDFDEPTRLQRAVVAFTAPPPKPPEHHWKNCPECRAPKCKWPRDRNKWERTRFDLWFPVFEARLTRKDCERLINAAGMPIPPKSSCTFCPNNTMEEWEELRRDEPEAFAAAVEMSRNADLDSPQTVGLLRRNPEGKKQLHEWADGKYGGLGPLFEQQACAVCECAT